MALLGERTQNLLENLYNSQLSILSHQNSLLFVNGTVTDHQCDLTLAARFAESTGFKTYLLAFLFAILFWFIITLFLIHLSTFD